MKLDGHLDVTARPDLRLRARLLPVGVELAGEGALDLATGPIELEVGSIPLTVRIPFHRRPVAIGSIGPFRACIRPLATTLRAVGVRAAGSVGSEDGGVEAELAGNCGAELDIVGDLLRHAGVIEDPA